MNVANNTSEAVNAENMLSMYSQEKKNFFLLIRKCDEEKMANLLLFLIPSV